MSLPALFASPHIVDLVLAVIVLEFAWLQLRPGAPRNRGATLDRALALAPGACLLLAVRAALAGMAWPWTPLCLAASLPFHLADLRRRKI